MDNTLKPLITPFHTSNLHLAFTWINHPMLTLNPLAVYCSDTDHSSMLLLVQQNLLAASHNPSCPALITLIMNHNTWDSRTPTLNASFSFIVLLHLLGLLSIHIFPNKLLQSRPIRSMQAFPSYCSNIQLGRSIPFSTTTHEFHISDSLSTIIDINSYKQIFCVDHSFLKFIPTMISNKNCWSVFHSNIYK